jgi:hypothetical protein
LSKHLTRGYWYSTHSGVVDFLLFVSAQAKLMRH